MYYHLITLGCQMNVSDSERMHSILQGMGYIQTDNEEEANLLGVIACSVRQKAIDKVYSRIHKWNKWKNRSDLITFVSGCVLPADKEKFLKLFDLVFPMSEANQLPEMINEYGVTSGITLRSKSSRMPLNENIFSLWNTTPSYQSGFEAFVPIQNGCDKFCTFCAVPYTRGREVSRPSVEILEEIQKLVRAGYKSITLLGQNVNSYGLDKKGEEISFAQLLEQIGELGNVSGREFRVYYTSPHPRDMSHEVIDVMSRYRVLAKMVHLPLQSGDDKVLVKMNRAYNLEKYREIVNYIRKKMPEATLFTDIIVGFTGETEEQFMNTSKAMEEFKFNMAYIAKYSARPGAASFRWDDDVSIKDKKDRFERLTRQLSAISENYNKTMIGKTYRVLVVGKDRKAGHLYGLTEGKIIVRFASSQESLVGSFTDISIGSASDFSVEGERQMVNSNQFKVVAG
ncbi:MAG: tRNA (N6-isopentenyl adenosine(37)-C2)-methylthiotransferase MiaB [Bacteroidales bacterium]|nr:tRNA (N6-isopentenyl adenosine(37)-C2)-methylthiotransferase MiaB [Bacteroidales bacterium]